MSVEQLGQQVELFGEQPQLPPVQVRPADVVLGAACRMGAAARGRAGMITATRLAGWRVNDGESFVSGYGVGIHPDLPRTFVHFTGRPRQPGDEPPAFADERLDGRLVEIASASARILRASAGITADLDAADSGAEARLVSILIMGKLMGARVFGTSQPVICFTEASEAARQIMLRDGVVDSRGPYAPWGLLLHRQALIDQGARKVLHLSAEELAMTDHLPDKLRNRRVRYDPGSADWLHEREWRLCFDAGEPPELRITPDLIAGVIVGRQGWTPPLITAQKTIEVSERVTVEHTWSSRSAHGLKRWWWTGKDLVEDGTIDLDVPDVYA